jgi:hypothetical protein
MWNRILPVPTSILTLTSLRNGRRRMSGISPSSCISWTTKSAKTWQPLTFTNRLSPPLVLDRWVRELNLLHGWRKSRISQSFKHDLGHEVNTCTKVTKSVLDHLIIYSARDRWVPQVFPVKHYQFLPLILNLMNGPPGIGTNIWPPRWLTPSGGH